jgi:uncharacterized damage-inducible protein DinB
MVWTAPRIIRTDEPFVGDERAMLDGFLDWHRATLLHKCAGLTGGQLARQGVPPSRLSLLGLVRHLAAVERTWFRRRFLGESLDELYWRPDKPDAAFEEVDPDRADTDMDTLISEWEACRQAVAGASLEATFTSERWGEMSLRWIYLHMIGEYAHHNGHADLLRERIDGATGW